MKRRVLLIAAMTLVFWGVGQMARGAYIHSKASLAQVLIRRAWMKASKKGGSPKPWPWADTTPVARLISPTHDIDLVVLAGSSGRTLAFGPGHVSGTALPGAHGNVVVGGHRDTHFGFLRDVHVGEPLTVESTAGARTEYRVTSTAIVDSNDDSILRDRGDDRLTLITCYPFDAIRPGGPLRFVVTAIAAPD